MKISFILTCTWAIFSIKKTQSSMAPNPFYPLRPEDLTEGEIKELQYLDEHFHRLKRSDKSGSGSGSGDILLTISRAVALGLGRKLTQVAKGSAGAVVGASGGFSKGSSSGDGKQWSYEPSDSYGPPSYGPSETTGQKIDVWDLKSSILNTLLQAVKAIKGGLLAINGQLIKGSGYVVSAKGKLISSSGDAVTRLGKNIISNAVLIKPEEKHPSSDYGPPPSYYDGPPPSSSGYAVESHYHHESIGHPDVKLPSGSQAGILILKKIPGDHHRAEESKIPPFKPLSPAVPTLGAVVGKFFTASTSLDPHKPTPFGNTAPEILYQPHEGNHHHHFEEPRVNIAPPHPSNEPILQTVPSGADYGTSGFQSNDQLPSPPATSYGVPFENSPSYINDHLSAEASQNEVHSLKLTRGELDQLQSSKSNSKRHSDKAKGIFQSGSNAPYSAEYLASLSAELPGPSTTNFLKSALYPESSEFMDVAASHNFPPPPKYTSKHKPSKSHEFSSAARHTIPKSSSGAKLRAQTENRHRRPSIDVVRSLTYELTPDGPKRLT